MASCRSLTTTTAVAGTVLIALCFMPTASATPAERTGATAAAARPTAANPTTSPVSTAGTPAARTAQAPTGLADTGAVDTTPYVVGGAGFLGVGAALLLGARRRAVVMPGA